MPRFTFPELPLDGLLRRAAARVPCTTALTSGATTVTYGQLDARADRIARCLARLTGRRNAVVGVANTLDTVFPAAYYGASRSGATVALINPLLNEHALHHVCATAGVEVAVVPPSTAEQLTKLRDRLPLLRTVVVTDADDGVVPGDAVPLHVALAGVSDDPYEPEGPGTDPGSVACLHFTTGTTGRSKGVRLTHRNVVANATQTALAHRLDATSVTLNHLPLFHVMHLNSAVSAGASQILCPDPDPVASLAVAAREGCTHYYGLPARLHRLADDPRLAQAPEGVPAGPRLTAVLSGGTALAPAAARRLQAALEVPVVQGYGLAELSPLSHTQRPGDAPVHGCVGWALPGTECRVVELDSRQPVPVGAIGEVQVRGPQVMAGYQDDDEPSPVDAGGWFSTGDIGRLDEDGRLYLADRLGDVFKYDNELVSPTAVERVIEDDPRVTECVVVGRPDPVHGATAWAGVVLRDPPPGPRDAVLASVAERANRRLAVFERLHTVEALDAVPRTPTGKPERQALRRRLRA
ncbi:class I adenylate-forming enzyme family protein [Streptomyces sp. NPDC006172]|uniref:class I adenylate-forming enzyme family protein n=1 Tax=Streptomyces sp. NPDC006172 TaxID=3154470 RepID=UPI0033D84D8F